MSLHGPATALVLGACILAVLGSGCGTSEDDRPAARAAAGAPTREPALGSLEPAVSREARVKAQRGAPFRLVRPPLVFIVEQTGLPVFQARLRFNRKLPSDSEGAFMQLRLGSRSGGDAPPQPYLRRSRHCYGHTLINKHDDPALRDVRVGSRVPLTIGVGSSVALIRPERASTIIRRTVTVKAGTREELLALGCR